MVARLSVIGIGDIPQYSKLFHVDSEFFDKRLDNLANELAKGEYELICVPDRGFSYELAKRVVSQTGRSVIGVAPLSDTEFGVKHIQEYLQSKVDGKLVLDPIIDSLSWYKHNFLAPLTGDASLILGLSLGTLIEISASLYMYKLFMKKKPGVEADPTSIMKNIRAGTRGPFTLILYKPFMLSDLPLEIYKYADYIGARIVKIRSAAEIHKHLETYS